MSNEAGEGTLFIVSAPSGAGKTTIIRGLFAGGDFGPSLHYSVSHTTRSRRPGEVEGRDYYFVDEARFRRMIEAEAFYEWALVHGQLKGTSKAEVAERLASGRDVLVDIDVQGAAQIRTVHPDAVSVFILPPSIAELRRRLADRGLDDAAQIARRTGDARRELSEIDRYDYAIVNDQVERAVAGLVAVIRAERHRRRRLRPVIDRLLAELPAAFERPDPASAPLEAPGKERDRD